MLYQLSYWVIFNFRMFSVKWQGWLDSNQRVRESKSLALPLGYTPISGFGDKKDRTGSRRLRPYALFVWGG